MKIYPEDKVTNNGKVYAIIFPDRKFYIGKTCETLNARIGKHKSHMKVGRESKVYVALRDFGFDNCIFALIENNIPEDMLNTIERFYIDKLNTIDDGYNTTNGASENGGEYKKFSSKEAILNVYNDLKDLNLTMTEIANKYEVSVAEIGHINKGLHHKIYSKHFYPIRKFIPKTTKVEILEIASLLISKKDDYTSRNMLHINIGALFNKNRKTIANIDKGNVQRSYLIDNGYCEFPLSK